MYYWSLAELRQEDGYQYQMMMMMMTTISPHYHIIAITIDSERVMVSKSVNKIMLITISITFPSNATESYLPLLLLLLRGHLFFCWLAGCPTEY